MLRPDRKATTLQSLCWWYLCPTAPAKPSSRPKHQAPTVGFFVGAADRVGFCDRWAGKTCAGLALDSRNRLTSALTSGTPETTKPSRNRAKSLIYMVGRDRLELSTKGL